MTRLINRPVTIVRRSPSGETDDYGNEIATETLVETVGELQQRRRDEPGDQGDLSDTLWDGYFPAGTALDTGDGVIADGLEYEVVGDPWQTRNPRTQALGQVQATLRRTAGSETAS